MSKTYIPVALRRKVAAQARHRCGSCLSTELATGMAMDFDHFIPEALGGLTEEENLWLACPYCNAFKANKISAVDTETGETVSLFNPRNQVWTDHFAWTAEGDEIIGLTPIGRATVVALQLNRELLVQARRIWKIAGIHPPKS